MTQTWTRSQLDLTEQAALQTRKPSLDRTNGAPLCSKLWDPLILRISLSFKPRVAGISLPTHRFLVLNFLLRNVIVKIIC